MQTVHVNECARNYDKILRRKAKQIEKFRKSINARRVPGSARAMREPGFSMYIREEEYSIPKDISTEELSAKLDSLSDSRKKFQASMLRVKEVVGLLQRIELIPSNRKFSKLRLTSLVIFRSQQVYTLSYFWEGYTEYEDDVTHYATLRRLRKRLNNEASILRALRYVFPFRSAMMSPELYERYLRVIHRRDWISVGGRIFRKKYERKH